MNLQARGEPGSGRTIAFRGSSGRRHTTTLGRLRRLVDQPHAPAQPRQHVDQRIGTKQVDSSAQEVANARVRHPQGLRCLSLNDDELARLLSQQSVRALFYARHQLSLMGGLALEARHIVSGVFVGQRAVFADGLTGDWSSERLVALLSQASNPPEPRLRLEQEASLSPSARALLRDAIRIARDLGSALVEPGHLLVAALEQDGSAIRDVLSEAGLTRVAILDAMRRQTGGG